MNPLLKALHSRHRILEDRIQSEQKSPAPDSLRIMALKKIKLRMREQIEFLQRTGSNGKPMTPARRPGPSFP
ncbi:hypothetical protein J2858_003447 [Neorhizobium galegae]|uniref:YdcH family protein n=1 Tax=Neorhizobium galegae TaxID=399 RepID=UPI001AE37BCC|nr:YdcH family protein [Neorhizobium galegae]MBP2550511.1 hypothetical protein [Neorhizobium galegae]